MLEVVFSKWAPGAFFLSFSKAKQLFSGAASFTANLKEFSIGIDRRLACKIPLEWILIRVAVRRTTRRFRIISVESTSVNE